MTYFHILAMEIVAEAIENSELVIIFMSDSYKRDNHCQAQAEYALITKRLLLPLVVHDGYKPDGWLSSIISNNNYIDIGKYDFKVASEMLLKEIEQRQPRKNIIDVKPTVSTPAGFVRSPSGTMSVVDKPDIPAESSALNGATSSSMSSFPLVTINKQQQAPMNSTSRSSTPGIIFSVSPVIVVKQQQKTPPIQPVSASSIPDSSISGAPMTVDKQQQPTAPMHSIPKSTTSEVSSSTISITDISQLEVLEHSTSRSSTPSSTSSDPTVINLKQEKRKLVQPDLGLSMPATGASATSAVINKQQQQTSVPPVSRSATPAIGASTAPVVINQQPPQESAHSARKSSISNIIPFDASVNIEKKQQQPMNSVTRSPSTSAVPSVTFNDAVQKQQQQTPSRSNSRSATPATLPVTLQTNGREQPRLPDKYTERRTYNSIYRHISINAWRDNDVLDYLFDLHLYPMMPLCETMSGKALLRLFRICQKKPSRVYDQLNEELRTRFNGLTLSMGTYMQFLIEMDSLVGPTLDELPPLPPLPPTVAPAPNIFERVIFMPPANPQPISAEQRSRSSTRSSKLSQQSKTIKPAETLPETTTSRSSRIVERAIYRPASNVGRPYNFVVESVEEPTILHDQVQRYGNQLLSLDETARDHREINSFR
jgi:hypothetical protein